jgi:secondary thiamine-phosphate synthase enzyme
MVEAVSNGALTRQAVGRLSVETSGQGFLEITLATAEFVASSGIRDGLLTIFCRHTSASLTIQENADPDVRRDMLDALDRLAPEDAPYRHRSEGPDDMPAHVKAALLPVSLSIPVAAGRMLLGTWQGIWLWEHRSRPHRRSVVAHLG